MKTRLLSCFNKADRVIGYEAKLAFRDGLVETHCWFERNWEIIEKSSEIS